MKKQRHSEDTSLPKVTWPEFELGREPDPKVHPLHVHRVLSHKGDSSPARCVDKGGERSDLEMSP